MRRSMTSRGSRPSWLGMDWPRSNPGLSSRPLRSCSRSETLSHPAKAMGMDHHQTEASRKGLLYRLWMHIHNKPGWLSLIAERASLSEEDVLYLDRLDEAWALKQRTLNAQWREDVRHRMLSHYVE